MAMPFKTLVASKVTQKSWAYYLIRAY